MSLALGKYAFAVLAAWGATLVLLVAIVAQTLVANARARRALDREVKPQRKAHDGREAARGRGARGGPGEAAAGAGDGTASARPSRGGRGAV